MSKSEFETYPVRVGYDWSITFTDPKPDEDNPTFPVDATYTAHVKQDRSETVPLGTLTTSGGEITRVDDSNLGVTIPASVTNVLIEGQLVYFDLVRTDGTSPEHMNIEVGVPVKGAITNV